MATLNKKMALSPRQPLNGQRVLRIPGRKIKIATWNVTSMFESGKLHNTIEEMSRMQIDILGISEMRWPGVGKQRTNGATVYYSGNNEPHHRNGVAVIVKTELDSYVKNVIPISDRIIVIQLAGKPLSINIIQIYAPTADKNEQVVEEFYEQLNAVLKSLKKSDMCYIMGDFNSKVGKGKQGKYVGEFGLGERNERGDRLIQFCEEQEFIVANTFFKQPPRRLYTWIAPGDNPQKIIRNQIDYVLVTDRFKNSIKNIKTYPGADVNSNHNPLVATVHIRLKKLIRNSKKIRLDVSKLKDPATQDLISKDINKYLKSNIKISNSNNIEENWTDIKNSLVQAGTSHLKQDHVQKNKSWMTDEILQMIQERRKHKNKNSTYREINTKIRRKIKEAKRVWISEKCEEIEALDKKYDSHNMHKKIKELTGKYDRRSLHSIQNNDGKYLITVEEQLSQWKKYIDELFSDARTDFTVEGGETGPIITEDELKNAIKLAKNGKATGPDDIPAELLKLIDNENIKIILQLFNNIYKTGHIPTDWLKSVFITLPKVTHPKLCQDYRTISLMSHTLKIFLKIIHGRIFKKCEEYLTNTQFGFRNGLGTRDALFAINVLAQRCRDVNKDVHIGIVDFEKAFDKVRHNELLNILNTLNLDKQDVNIIANLYWRQTAAVRVKDDLSEEILIQRGVRQGCILSPLLFNVYSEMIFKEALSKTQIGININGVLVSNIRYADDSLLLAETAEDLQTLFSVLHATCQKYGLEINIKKTKYMTIQKQMQNTQANIKLDQKDIERVKSCKYLGTIINEDWKQDAEIKSRIEQARQAFIKMKPLLCCTDFSIPLRKRILKCYIFPIVLYGTEAWTLTDKMCKRITAFEMWTYRRMLRISWIQKITNEEVLRKLNTETELLYTIKKRKLEYLGHIMRNKKYELLQLIIQGKINGKRGPGRRRDSWLKNLRVWFGKTSADLFREAVSKIKIALLIANLRK